MKWKKSTNKANFPPHHSLEIAETCPVPAVPAKNTSAVARWERNRPFPRLPKGSNHDQLPNLKPEVCVQPPFRGTRCDSCVRRPKFGALRCLNLPKLRNPAYLHPLYHKNISLMVKTRAMRKNELTRSNRS